MASPSTIVTRGFGSFGSVNLLLSRGYGTTAVVAPPAFVPGTWPRFDVPARKLRFDVPARTLRFDVPARKLRHDVPKDGVRPP